MNKYGGGALTTANGLKFEQDTKLNDVLIKCGYEIDGKNVKLGGKVVGMIASKTKFYKDFLEPRGIDSSVLSKKMFPDEVFINFLNNTVFIIEKKFQSQSGSVDEKLQTYDFKRRQYEKLLAGSGFKVKYIYVCNDWFKQSGYRDVIEYINDSKCFLFFNEMPLDFLGLSKAV